MEDDIKKTLAGILLHSKFLASLTRAKQEGKKSRLFGDEVRTLSIKEIETLSVQGNHCDDWSRIRVTSGFVPGNVRGNIFVGDCTLGVFSGTEREAAPGVRLQDGIYGSTIVDSEIGNHALVRECGLVARYLVRENAVVFRVHSLYAEKNCTFGNGVIIPLGMETGGRELVSCAEIDVTVAERLALRRDDGAFREFYLDFAKRYQEAVECDYGIVEPGARILNTARVSNTYCGEHVLVDGAVLIDNCTLLGGPAEKTEISHGAVVRNSVVQWGCTVTTLAIVVDSILTEHSHVERHGKVSSCVLGPNSGVAEGEATSCLIGPFVGFHHQALLIAALWPEGKGNVAYGANVGSNHTSRAPDQEIFCGEGLFFGLGTNIKFPADYSRAPYSIVATGVTTLPQRVCFPFSLIMSPSRAAQGLPLSLNEIIPAWVLSDNIYAVRRNEEKYKKRNKAIRTRFELSVFRPDIVDLMAEARDRLRDVKEIKDLYTESDIPGLGKNFLIEEKRVRAIAAYDFYIEYYCLSGLKDRIAELAESKALKKAADLSRQKTDSPVWEHQRALLTREGYQKRTLGENLLRLCSMLEKMAADTLLAKEKDDRRGEKIIPDYEAVATRAQEDSFIMATQQETAAAVETIKALIAALH